MTSRYFQNFPRIFYSNSYCIDITRRATMLNTVSNNPYVFYTYDIGDSERADNFSNRYYEDPYLSWLLYFSNQIIDPYYEWYLTDLELKEHVSKKYGSYENSKSKTKHYRNNWENKEEIAVSVYESLSSSVKKFWEPVYKNSVVYSYKRKEQDWIYNTNKIVSYSVSNNNFTLDEICDIKFEDGVTGSGQVVQTSNGVVQLQHINGNYQETPSANSYIYGRESGVNTSISEVLYVFDVIPDEEIAYFSPITYYDYENESNEYNRTIKVIDSDLKYLAVENLRTILEE